MIRILLCCEGPNDQGAKVYIDGEYSNTDGVMQVFIRKASGNNNLDFVVKTHQDLKNIKVTKKFLGKDGITSIRLAYLAKQEKCTHLAYHRDEDNKGFKEIYQQVLSYFTDAEKSGIACLAIVPMHMTESWLLTDETAFEKVCGTKPDKPCVPKKPEDLWGNKHISSSDYPKNYFTRVLEQYHEQRSSELYLQIAEKTNIDILCQKCPESFGHFVKDMQSFITEVPKE